ncbi:MAG: sigma-70 family RNA polymerase sigma factor [Candidatus Promineifilaceae bacterium]
MLNQPSLSLSNLHIDVLADHCRELTVKRESNSADYCFELFRRAFDLGDDAAWNALVKQYLLLVCSWIRKANSGDISHEEVNDLAYESLTRFWKAIDPKVPYLRDSFSHSAELLRYLNRCTISTLHTHWRHANRQAQITTVLTAERQLDAQNSSEMEESLSDRDTVAEQVVRLKEWLRQHVQDPQEQLLLELHFGNGLSPREIAKQAPDQFESAQKVRRIKERILKRARRSLLLQK